MHAQYPNHNRQRIAFEVCRWHKYQAVGKIATSVMLHIFLLFVRDGGFWWGVGRFSLVILGDTCREAIDEAVCALEYGCLRLTEARHIVLFVVLLFEEKCCFMTGMF
jgi:hypothetical protein